MDNEIQGLWNVGSNSEYDDECWNIIFAEEGLIPEESDFSLDELEDEWYDRDTL
jgi:hypothetical protein